MIEVDFDRDAIAARIGEELRKLNLSQRKISELFGCNQHLVSNYFTGKTIPSAYYLTVMHHAGCDILYILTGERHV
jgi:transcriptional regulator with XRE-family HTH domain